jgi:HTH-type transcriptional regulator/antitoxin HigA
MHLISAGKLKQAASRYPDATKAIQAFCQTTKQAQWQNLIAKKDSRTPEETALFRLLVKLIEDYEEQVYNLDNWSDLAPHEILQHLLESSGTKQADLVGIISPSKGLISSIVNGKRAISKEQAKKLGVYLKVSPSLFL